MKVNVTHAALLFSAACAFSEPATPTVAFSTDTARLGEVIVYPVRQRASAQDAWQRLLSVRVGEDTTALPLLGTYTVAGDTLRFRPRFPPSPGVTYVARVVIPSGGASAPKSRNRSLPDRGIVTARWSYDAPAGDPSTVVSAIYPSTDAVPMNLLRMYVEFSAPMSSGHAFDFVKLYTDQDSLVAEPFFTAGGVVELWDPDHTRLTILFDPGRIKRDLKPHEEAGLPLRTGKRYRLVIESAWRDAQGLPLTKSFTKEFRVGAQDRVLIRTSDWRVVPPRADSRDSLIVTFPEPLDRAQLLRMLSVRDSLGALIDGESVVADREMRWAFVPRNVWSPVTHALLVDTELEDLAGNNLKKLFDVAPGDVGATGVTSAVVRLPFQPRPSGSR